MATQTKRPSWNIDITSNAQPSAASPDGAIRQKQAIGATIGGVLSAADTAYGMKKQYDVNKGVEEARQVRDTFFESNMEAEVAEADFASNAAQQRSLMERNKFLSTLDSTPAGNDAWDMQSIAEEAVVNKSVIDNLRSEAIRLQAASRAGMSNAEYAMRVQAVTKATIAKYPGLGEQIRQEMGRVSGLPGADEFAAYAFVRSRFSGGQKGEGGPKLPSSEDIIKDVAKNGGYPLEDVTRAYTQDRPAFEQMQSVARDMLDADRAAKSLEQRLKAETIVSDTQARAHVDTFRSLAAVHGTMAGVSLFQDGSFNRLQEGLQAARGDTAQQEVLYKSHAEYAKSVLSSQKAKTKQELFTLQTSSKGRISKEVMAELEAAIDKQYAEVEASVTSPGGIVAQLGVWNAHKDKTLDQKIKIMGANTNFMNSMMSNHYVQMYFAQGAEKESLKTIAPEVFKSLEQFEQTAWKNFDGVNSPIEGGKAIAVFGQAHDRTDKTPVPSDTPTKTGDAGIGARTLHWVKQFQDTGDAPTKEAANALAQFMQRQLDGALFQTATKNLPALAKLWEAMPADIKADAQRAMDRGYTTHINRHAKTVEQLKGKFPNLQLTVVPGTAEVAAWTPGGDKMPTGVLGYAERVANVREGARQEKQSYYENLGKAGGLSLGLDQLMSAITPLIHSGMVDKAKDQATAEKLAATRVTKQEQPMSRNVAAEQEIAPMLPYVVTAARMRHVTLGEPIDKAFKTIIEQLSTGKVEPLVKVEPPATEPPKPEASGAKLEAALSSGIKLPDGQSFASTPEEKDVVTILNRELAAEKAALSLITSKEAKERVTENIRALEAELAKYKPKQEAKQ